MEKRDFKRSKVKKETTHRSLIYDARQLTKGGKKAIIKLDNVEYILRITKNAKLILTKWAFYSCKNSLVQRGGADQVKLEADFVIS